MAGLLTMAYKFVDQDRFRELAGRGNATGAVVERLGSVARAADDDSRVVTFVFSDGTVDRMGDKINPYGWELGGFRKNPVCLWAHLSTEPPIGRVVRTFVSGDRLMGNIQFASAETYPFADTIYRLVQEKFINAVSVGFMPILWDWADGADRRGGIDFEKQELLEISVVPIPANVNALIEARTKSWGRGSARMAVRQAPVPSPLSFAGTAVMRLAQLHHAYPETDPRVQRECQIRAASKIKPETPAERRAWLATLRRLCDAQRY
jgi:HK97 family phage prohead protease